jgi:hypothetical protein
MSIGAHLLETTRDRGQARGVRSPTGGAAESEVARFLLEESGSRGTIAGAPGQVAAKPVFFLSF